MKTNLERKNLAEGVGSTPSATTASLNKYIPEDVYQNLPEPLKSVAGIFEDRERDIILLSSLGVLSACLPNVFGVYAKRKYHTNLFTFIIAPPASGKGVMAWSKRLIDPIHEDLVRESKRRISAHRNSPDSEGTEPKLQLKIVPGNTSSAKFYNHFQHAEDSLLIFETEADSLSKMMKQDWGDFSDIMRNSFHHEAVSISRASDDKYFVINNPKLSIVLSGTPNQVRPLIDSKENGLFSRFIYYYYDEIGGWKDVSPQAESIDYDSFINQKAQRVKELYNLLKGIDSIEVKMSTSQWNSFQKRFVFATELMFKTNKPDFMPVVRRLGLMTFRIIMILTVLRKANQINENNKVLYAEDIDVDNAINIIRVLFDHSLNVFDKYEKKVVQMPMGERALYTKLPQEFKRREALEVAKIAGFPERTFDEILKRWEGQGVIEKISHGNYGKVS